MNALRIDKWLWAARFFKTRRLAQAAVEGGRVKRAGERVKPARELRVGDALEIAVGELLWKIEVRALSDKRGPAPAARLLYAETEAGRLEREAAMARRKLENEPAQELAGRPTKRDRRSISRLRGY
ncbi:MAG: RNA-binding S4 domain-containing protein [Betaproteobacteria bacterium]|nr:RNA-binding S4 domain-containing protein [Betaproteobacteria bacterium]